MNYLNKFLIIGLVLQFFFSPLKAEIVNKIDIQGNSRISDETIKVYGNILELGSDFTKENLDEILKNLYSTNFFKDIDIQIKNNTLFISLTEYPIINQLIISGEKSNSFKDQIKNVLIQLSNEFFNDVCQRDSAKLGVSFSKISYKDPKSRWGSCSSERKLMFSWRLIMAPREVSAYVAAHEVAHLVHMNHSKSFWETVRFLCPDYMSHRLWLRYNGKMLHRFIF